jgi:(p)ppGpp synthase/HD superfamily hydrolase
MAAKAHEGQRYGDVPFIAHPDAVVAVLKRFQLDDSDLLAAAYLHDTLEDTSLPYHKIRDRIGRDVAELVYAVTDELGRNRKERKAKTLPKTAKLPRAILVKLADRIANIEQTIADGNLTPKSFYKREHASFKQALFEASPPSALPLWEHLEELLASSR